MDKRLPNGKFAKGRRFTGLDSPTWKGGLPNCSNCGKQLSQRHPKYKLCRKCFISQAVGENSLRWKGGKKNNNGYVMLYAPDHPNCDQQGYVREHRLVMEKHLGRYLHKEEVVHHVNHNRSDNRIENLIILSKNEHDKYHLAINSKNLKPRLDEHRRKISTKFKEIMKRVIRDERGRIKGWLD